LHYLFYVIKMVDFNTRSGADSGISGILDDDENVELEKSNVLLMGPTGSGITFTTTSFFPFFFVFSYKTIIT